MTPTTLRSCTSSTTCSPSGNCHRSGRRPDQRHAVRGRPASSRHAVRDRSRPPARLSTQAPDNAPGLLRARHGLCRRLADRLRRQRAGLRRRQQLSRRVRPEHASPSFSACRSPSRAIVSGLGGDGLGGGNADWYSFNVNAGDNLVITTTTPGAPTRQRPAVRQRSRPDDQPLRRQRQPGRHRDRQRPRRHQRHHRLRRRLTPGSYRCRSTGSSKTNMGEYTISIQGDTGGLAPFTVTSTNPAAGSDIGYQVSTMDATFSSSVLLSSISDSDFTIDGNDATGVTLINAIHRDLHVPDDLQRRSQRDDQRRRGPPGHRGPRPTASASRPTTCRRSSCRARSPTGPCCRRVR